MTEVGKDPSIATEADLDVLREQLDRVPRGVVGIGARCVCGRPTVVKTAPRLEDGSPFPTTFYLTSPPIVRLPLSIRQLIVTILNVVSNWGMFLKSRVFPLVACRRVSSVFMLWLVMP